MSKTAFAKANGIQLSPRKVREVILLVKGRTVQDALTILEHTPRRSAKAVSKVIASAEANATTNHNIKKDGLKIDIIEVGDGPALKRYRAGAHGRAKPYKKRTSNIRVVVSGTEKPARKKAEDKPKADTKKSTKSTKESK